MTHSSMQPTDSAPPNPFAGLIRSRKFWVAMLDVLVSTVFFFAAKYAGAAIDDVKFLIAAYQPVILLVIHSITEEDKARTQASAAVQVAQHEAAAAVDVAEAKAPADRKPWPPKS